jgi:hypothetical protein
MNERERGADNTWRQRLFSALPFAACLSVLLVYALLVQRSAVATTPTQLLTELPLLVYLLALLASPLRPGVLRWLAALLPLLGLYVVHDQFYLRWGDVPNFGDVALLGDLMHVLSPFECVLVALALAVPLGLWVLQFERRLKHRILLLGVPLGVLILLLRTAPSQTYELLNQVSEDLSWSDRRSTERWGRLYAALVREARRGKFAQSLREFTPLSRSGMQLDERLLSALDGRNVHIVVLESFVDLRLLSKVRFSEPPFDGEFARWVDPYLGASFAPVFGGETARSEFEVLCGVPSLGLFGVEFLAFSGEQSYCLPTILHGAGYHTVLTFPHGPVFFNTRKAYPGLGFREILYGDQFSPPGVESIAMGGQDYLFDGDLFPQNLRKVRALLETGRPFLNYVMTLYGHWPFDIDTARHPMRVQVSAQDEELRRIANQMLRRTQALHAHVRALIEADPRGVILLVADHLPPLPSGKADYARYGLETRPGLAETSREARTYENFLLAIVGGQPVKLPRMRHFDLPHWLLNELSQGAYCQAKHCEFGRWPIEHERYLERYRTILGLASRRERLLDKADSK